MYSVTRGILYTPGFDLLINAPAFEQLVMGGVGNTRQWLSKKGMELDLNSPLPVPLAVGTTPSPNRRAILEAGFFKRLPQIK